MSIPLGAWQRLPPSLFNLYNFQVMKIHILIIALLAMTVFACQPPQAEPAPEPKQVGAQFSPRTVRAIAQDTLSTSASVDTAIFDLGSYSIAVDYDVQVSTSVETGTGNYTYYVQAALNPNGTEYATLHTVSSASDTSLIHSGNINGGKIRVLAVAPSSTQLTTIRPVISTIAQ